ncbi:hypothetical protein OG900_33665 [Streptomyces sp. NBC_00433]
MTAPTQTPVLFVDRTGDVWRPNGLTPAGDVLMVCDQPQDPADRGDGESFPWTRQTVESRFGPLVPLTVEQAFVDLEQSALAEADRKFGDVHGDAAEWSPLEEIQYVRLIERVHGVFHQAVTR